MRTPGSEITKAEPERLFILGAPRSGTTFLASLLRDTRFGTPVESHFITKYADRLDAYGSLERADNFIRLTEAILSERPVMQWGLKIDPADLHAELMQRPGGPTYDAVVDALFLARKDAAGRSAWSDKTPHYLGSAAVLDELFPGARYIYIVRDGRDVAQSLIDKPWGPNNALVAAEYWSRLNAEHDVLKRLEADGMLLPLKYEGLVTDIGSGIGEIADFLDERLSGEEVRRLSASVRPENALKWKTSMSERNVRLFDAVAAETLERFGYEVRFGSAHVPAWKRVALRLHDRVLWARFMFVSNVVDGIKIRFLGKEPFAE